MTSSLPPENSAATGALDLSVLEKMVGGNPAKFRKFGLLFISSMEDVLLQVDAALVKQDLSALVAMGHRAKSTALNVGASGLADQCKLLEMAANAGQHLQAQEVAQGLRPMFAAISAKINLEINSAIELNIDPQVRAKLSGDL